MKKPKGDPYSGFFIKWDSLGRFRVNSDKKKNERMPQPVD